MSFYTIPIPKKKHIALVAHDHMKDDLLEWALYNRETLSRHHLYATGTTGSVLETELDLVIGKTRYERTICNTSKENKRKVEK